MFSSRIDYHSTKDRNFKIHSSKMVEQHKKLVRSVSFFIDKTYPQHPNIFFKNGKIGSGSFGEVFKFTNIYTRENLLVKEMSFYNQNQLKRMVREVELFRNVNGFCIFQITFPCKFRLIMRRLPGKPLANIIDKIFQDPIAFIKKYIAILYTAKMMHRKKIVHGDLSMDNILLDNDHAYFCDFGLAVKIGEMTSGFWNNSYPYHAPELKNQIPADPNQDVYSLGVILSKSLVYVQGIEPYHDRLKRLVEFMTKIEPNERISIQKVLEECRSLRVEMLHASAYSSIAVK